MLANQIEIRFRDLDGHYSREIIPARCRSLRKEKQMDSLTLSNPVIAGVALLFEAWASKYFGFDVIRDATSEPKEKEK